jgi:site-specific DNA-cytosine methylase
MHLYKQAGNSVVVPVIERIAKEIMIALERAQNLKDKMVV